MKFASFDAKMTNVNTSNRWSGVIFIVSLARYNKDLSVRLEIKLAVSYDLCVKSYDIYVMAFWHS